MNLAAFAVSAAARTSSSVASGTPKRMFSRILRRRISNDVYGGTASSHSLLGRATDPLSARKLCVTAHTRIIPKCHGQVLHHFTVHGGHPWRPSPQAKARVTGQKVT
jgi:hypothetical protein